MPDENLSGKAGAVWRVEPPSIARTVEDIAQERLRMAGRHDALVAYRDHCVMIDDHHGVQDASSDLRELDAAEAALRWVLGERETLGY